MTTPADDDGLPDGVAWVRSTPEFTDDSTPAGLRSAHQLAAGVWGLLRVHDGTVDLVWEESGARQSLTGGESVVIPPERPHRAEPDRARFVIEIYR